MSGIFRAVTRDYQSASHITKHTAAEMRHELIAQSWSKFSLMIDESWSTSSVQSMIVYICTDYDGVACNYFLDCIPVEQATAESLFECLMTLHCMAQQLELAVK